MGPSSCQSNRSGRMNPGEPGGSNSRQDRDGCPTHACTLIHIWTCVRKPRCCSVHGIRLSCPAPQHKQQLTGNPAPCGHPPTHTPNLSTLHTHMRDMCICACIYAYIYITMQDVCKTYACLHVTDRNACTPCRLCLHQRTAGPPISPPPECAC